MTGRLIISGTREELSAADHDIVLDLIAAYAERASAIGVGDWRLVTCGEPAMEGERD